MKELTQKWEECLRDIRALLKNDAAYSAWFASTKATSLKENVLCLQTQSRLHAEVYEERYFDVLSKALRKTFGNGIKIQYRFPKSAPKAQKQTGDNGRTSGSSAQPASRKVTPEGQSHNPFIPELNPALSFENYCVGSSNKLPWTIAESIARQPFNSNFNPFFLYGDVGVGKTHLMQAIGLYVKRCFPDKRVVFLPMREFQRHYQNAYLNKKIPAFLNWFMQCDVLLFDDLQEIAGSEGTLNNALFPIFNHLQQHGKQMVFTCDRPPTELEDIEKRLIDRFKWGITEKLEAPDKTLRKKILTFKARKNGLDIPENVIDFIANSPLNSVREIEGIVLGIYTRAINLSVEIDLKLAKEVMKHSVKAPKKRVINFEMIVEAAAEQFRLNPDVIFSKSRVKDVADARMSIMYLAHKLLGLSTGSIGMKLGRKHSTVIHGIRAIEERLPSDSQLADVIAAIEKSL